LQRSRVDFDAGASSDEDGEIIAYRWRFGDGQEGSGVAPSHVYGNAGEYQVDLAVEDDSKTLSRFDGDGLVVRVNAAPIADPGPRVTVEPGQQVNFDGSASRDPDGAISRYHWQFGDGEEADLQRVAHAYSEPGIYTVRLQVSDDSGLEEGVDEGSVTVVVNHRPEALVQGPVRIAPGDAAWFDASASRDLDGEIADWRWRFSDGEQRAGAARVERRFEQPGIYYADVTVDDGRGLANSIASARTSVQVNHRPRAIPGEDLESCDTTLLFDASASVDGDGDALSYHWDFGDGQQGHGMQVSHSYRQGGIYPVLLEVDDGQGLSNSRHSASLTATINQRPIADAGEDRTVCAGDSIVFNGAQSVDPKGRFLKYHWWFGDEAEGDGVNPVQIFRKAGVYPVKLLVEDDTGLACGRDTDGMVLRVAESPIADAGEDIETCANTEITFDGSGSRDADGLVNSFAWDFGDGAQGGGPSPRHMYLEAGDYQASLTITGDQIGNCDNTDRDRVNVKVHAAPKAVIQTREKAAVDQPVLFDGSASSGLGASIVAWEWDFGDGQQASGEQVEHAYAEPGRYFVSLKITTDSGNQCDNVTQRTVITVNAAPTAQGKAPQAGAIHEVLHFDSSASSDPDGAVTNHIWDFGDGARQEGMQVTHAYREAGDYTVLLRVEDDSGQSNGSDEQRFALTINAPPQAQIDAPRIACRDQQLTFDASASSDGDGTIRRYDWRFGDGLDGEGEQVLHSYPRAGRYQIGLRVEDDSGVGNRYGFASHLLRVNRPPRLHHRMPALACSGEPVSFDASLSVDPDGDPLAVRWDFGDNATATTAKAEHSYAAPGRYAVTLSAQDGSGSACATSQWRGELRVNHPPQADAGDDRETWVGGVHDLVQFDASASHDADDERLGYHWSFGDGTSAEGMRVAHRYPSPGRYEVVLKVDDGTGLPCGVSTDTLVVEAKLREE
jgi:PKD repeat protein